MRTAVHSNNSASYWLLVLDAPKHMTDEGNLNLLLFVYGVSPQTACGLVAMFA